MSDSTAQSTNEPSKAEQESAKLGYDMFKHITTLSTGTIVVLATFLEKIFKNPSWQPLVIVTFVSLIFSLLCALGAMLYMVKHVRKTIDGDEGYQAATVILICFASFLLGISSLTIFSVRNFLV
jgi:Na+/H+ antiporter NhaC